jgi:hypothetical protein
VRVAAQEPGVLDLGQEREARVGNGAPQRAHERRREQHVADRAQPHDEDL